MNQYISNESLTENIFFHYIDPINNPKKHCKKNIPLPNINYETENLRNLNENEKPNTFRFRNSEIEYNQYFNKLYQNYANNSLYKKNNIFLEKLNFGNNKNKSVSEVYSEPKLIINKVESENNSTDESLNNSVETENNSTDESSDNIVESEDYNNKILQNIEPKKVFYTVPQSFDSSLYTAKLANIEPEELIKKNINDNVIFDRSYNDNNKNRIFIDDFIENENLILIIIFIIFCFYLFR